MSTATVNLKSLNADFAKTSKKTGAKLPDSYQLHIRSSIAYNWTCHIKKLSGALADLEAF